MPVILNIPVDSGSPSLLPRIDHWREVAAISGPLFFSPPEQPPSGPTWNCTSRCSSRFFDSCVFGGFGGCRSGQGWGGHLTVGLAISPMSRPQYNTRAEIQPRESQENHEDTIQMWVKLQSKPQCHRLQLITPSPSAAASDLHTPASTIRSVTSPPPNQTSGRALEESRRRGDVKAAGLPRGVIGLRR